MTHGSYTTGRHHYTRATLPRAASPERRDVAGEAEPRGKLQTLWQAASGARLGKLESIATPMQTAKT